MFNLFGNTTTEKFEHIFCEELQSIVENGNGQDNYELIDVRTPEEFHAGHIPGSRLINLMDPAFRDKVSALDPAKTYYVYCRSGSRSMTACRVMGDAGLDKLYNVKFGLMGWQGPLE